jgi:hypothetical protein
MEARTVVKVLGLVALLGLVVLIWMNFLRVSNLEDEARALRKDVDDLRQGAAPASPAATDSAVEVETQPFAGDPSGQPPQVLVLSGGRPVQKAVLALVELAFEDGRRVAVPAEPVILLPQVQVLVPLPPEAGCYQVPSRRPAWVLTLDGPNLKVASRDCAYAQPARGKLKGLITR